jgi:ATP-dependent helicase HrpA
LTGLLGGVARRADERTYFGPRNVKLTIFPGSGLAKKRPEWIMAAELVETDRLYARTVARIDPAWIEPIADHLLGRSYFEPHWDDKRGQVMGYERVSLYGLDVVKRRRIDFGKVDPEASREIFIRSALVEGKLRSPAPFLRHNADVVRRIEALGERSRRRDIAVDEQAMFSFFDRLVPGDVRSASSFDRWRRHVESKDSRALFLRREDLLVGDASDVTEAEFPDFLEVRGLRLPLRYRFDPGHDEDGLSVTIPIAVLNELPAGRFEWLVPGLLTEKIAAMLESLPKAIRKNFVPLPGAAARFARALAPSDAPLTASLAAELERSSSVRVPLEAFRRDAWPPHLSMYFRVVDESGRVVGGSRDFGALVQSLGVRAFEVFSRLPKGDIEREGLVAWSLGDLPRTVGVAHGHFALTGYPALVDTGKTVAVRVFATEPAAAQAHRSGVRRLYALKLADVVKSVRKSLPGIERMVLWFALLGSGDELKDDILSAAIDRVCIGEEEPVHTAAAFESTAQRARGELVGAARELSLRVEAVLSAYHDVMRAAPGADVRRHVGTLVYKGFVTRTPWSQLPHLARYLKAARLRVERLHRQPDKDREREALVAPLVRQYEERAARLAREGSTDPELERYRWLLEEWRVSLFAQELKTREPISEKRLAEQWSRVVS